MNTTSHTPPAFPPRSGRRLRVGDRVVDFPAREVRRDGRLVAHRVGIKSLMVLDLLAQRAGEVVTREECLAYAWAGTLPTDDVLTQAVKGLRRALRDDVEPRLVETISRSGYRLTVPVEWMAAPGGDGGPAVNPVASRPTRLPRLAASALAALLVTGLLGGWLWHRERESWHAPRVERIATQPGDERAPRLSPGGGLVVYVGADGALRLQRNAAEPSKPLAVPRPGETLDSPTWSPDGRYVAYLQRSPGKCEVAAVSIAAAQHRRMAACSAGMRSLDWSPDGRTLVGARPVGDGGTALVAWTMPQGPWRPVATGRARGDVESVPRFSPDGRDIAFVRRADAWIVPAGGGVARNATRRGVEIRGIGWDPDGRHLLLATFFRQGGGPHLGRVPADGGQIQSMGYYADIDGLDVARAARRVVVEETRSAGAIHAWVPGQRPVRLAASSGSDLLPSLSPDGRDIAFYSDRSGQLGLWIASLASSAPARRLGTLLPIPRHAPVWAANGQLLLLDGMQADRTGLFEVDVLSGRARAVPVPSGAPRMGLRRSPSTWDVVALDDRARPEMTRWRIDRERWHAEATLADVVAASEAADGGVFYTRASAPGVYRTGPALRPGVRVSPGPPRGGYRAWVAGATGIWWLDGTELVAPDGARTRVPVPASDTLVPVLGGRAPRFLLTTSRSSSDLVALAFGAND